MTTVLVACDSFKGSLSAREACEAIGSGIRRLRPDAELRLLPLADGGDGTCRVLEGAFGGRHVCREVTHPLADRTVEASWLYIPDAPERAPQAVVEMASGSGLVLVPPGERDPLRTTTAGTGELVAHAAAAGARRIWLTLGGSATVDGGTGAATALGWRFLDREGRPVPPGGAGLERIHAIEPPAEPLDASVTALCDVDNRLLGPRGAAAVFGPQKGARPADVPRLDAGLANLAERVRAGLGVDVTGLEGGGAAGGFAAGAVAFMGATLARGIDRILDAVAFVEALDGADWVVTGEGSLDAQSLDGKVVSGVLARARPAGVPVAAVAGRVALDEEALQGAGIAWAGAAAPPELEEEEAFRRAAELAADAGERFARSCLTS